MGEIAINSQTFKLCMVECNEAGEYTTRELTEEDIAKLSQSQQALVASLQQQAELMRKLAEIKAQAELEIEKMEYFCKIDREVLYEVMQWAKLGWGYKPKLHTATNKPHRAKPYWHRTRSFCVRKGYH